MEYKRLTQDEIDSLKTGTMINMGNGKVVEVTGFTKSKYAVTRVRDGKRVTEYDTLIQCCDSNGNEYKWLPHVLLSGTTETLDETILKCEYCGKLRPKNEMKNAKIRVNRGTRYHDFCKDDKCSGYYQMGCEG